METGSTSRCKSHVTSTAPRPLPVPTTSVNDAMSDSMTSSVDRMSASPPPVPCKWRPIRDVINRSSTLTADSNGPTTSTPNLAERNNVLAAEVDILLDKLACVTAENALLMRQVKNLQQQLKSDEPETEADRQMLQSKHEQQGRCREPVGQRSSFDEKETDRRLRNERDAVETCSGSPCSRCQGRIKASSRGNSFDANQTQTRASVATDDFDIRGGLCGKSLTSPWLSDSGYNNDGNTTPSRGPAPIPSSRSAPSSAATGTIGIGVSSPTSPQPKSSTPSSEPFKRQQTSVSERKSCAGSRTAPGQKVNSTSSDSTKAEGILFVVSDLLVDQCATVSECFLRKYNLDLDDVILARPEHEGLCEELRQNYAIVELPGGSAQNSARMCQWLLGVDKAVTVLGCVGGDDAADRLVRTLRKSRMNLRFAVNCREPTGTCCVCVVGSHRSMVTTLGASASLTLEHVRDPETEQLMKRAQCFYLEGFGLSHCFEVIRDVAQYSASHNVPLVFNVSAPYVATDFSEQTMELVRFADLVFCNRSEGLAFAAAHSMPADSVAEIALLMAALPKANGSIGRIVVITSGSNPAVVAQNGTVREFPVLPVEPGELVDTVGAGDAYVGGFLAGYVTGADIDKCMEIANAAAKFIVGQNGFSIPEDAKKPFDVDLQRLTQRRYTSTR